MKKLSLLLVFGLLFLFSVRSQDNGVAQSSDGKNWFVGAGVRGNVWINDNGSRYIKVWTKPSLAGEAFVGKWFSHKVGARLFLNSGTLHPFFTPEAPMSLMEDEKYVAGRVDFMLNFTNLFRSWSPDRFYNLIPYIGPGLAHSFDRSLNSPSIDLKTTTFMVGAGLLNTFRLSSHWNAYVNVGLDAMDAGFDGWKDENPNLFKSPSKFNGAFNASVGLIYNFGKSSKKEIIPPPVVVPETPKYTLTVINGTGGGSYEAGTVVNIAANTPANRQVFDGWKGDVSEVARLNSPNTTFTMGNTNATVTATYRNLPPEPPVVVEPVKLEPVFFRLDKSIIDADQEYKVKAAADFLNANPNAKLVVIGYADVQTAYPKYNLALSERRTKAVAKLLVTKYGIDTSRLKLDWKGDTVQPFEASIIRKVGGTKETPNSNEKNRVVMFSE